MNPDGLSYLDLASATLSGGPAQLLNAYWSPGYPALISIALFLLRPSPSLEFAVVHFVNFLIFVVALWSFSIFVRHWIAACYGDEIQAKNDKTYLTPFAFCTFLWFTLKFIGTEPVTPDLCVAAFVFLAAGITCRLSLPGASWKHYLVLGCVLGAGYYIKAALFPLSVALMAILMLCPPSKDKARPRLAFSMLVFLLVSAPLIAALSAREHKLTFGESGRLNYVWYVNRLYWTGGTGGLEHEPYTTPDHPAPKLTTKPVTLEFPSPVGGTYPLWYDPSYWYRGVKARFDWREQIAAVNQTLHEYKEIVVDMMALISGSIVLFALVIREKVSPAVPRSSWWQLLWPVAACAMYALVHVDSRFLGGFLTLFWLAVYMKLALRLDRRVAAAVCATVLVTVMLPFGAHLASAAELVASDLIHPRTPAYQTAALGLRDLGIKPGDRLAIVGDAHDCYYARYLRVHVIAQVPDAHAFWNLSPPELQSLTARLVSIGVNAVVAPNRPEASAPADWRDVKVSDSLHLSVLLLQRSGS